VKRLLVTGVSGLLGLNLAYLAADQFHVTGVLRQERAATMEVAREARFETVTADLTQPEDIERLLELAKPDIVVHCAAMTDVDRCEGNPEEAYQANVRLPGMLACAAARKGVKLLHISTDAVFDGLQGNYTESDTPNPIHTYARTKLEGEYAVANANPDALIARVNFYGWSWQGRRSLAEYFFNNLSQGNAVFGFSDLIFCPLLVNDMVEILLRMVEHDLSGIYHVVSAECQSKFMFGRMLAREFGFDENLVLPGSSRDSEMRAPRSPLLSLNCEKLARALGEALPAQQPAMNRYAGLYRQGYPQSLRSVFIRSDHSLA